MNWKDKVDKDFADEQAKREANSQEEFRAKIKTHKCFVCGALPKASDYQDSWNHSASPAHWECSGCKRQFCPNCIHKNFCQSCSKGPLAFKLFNERKRIKEKERASFISNMERAVIIVIVILVIIAAQHN